MSGQSAPQKLALWKFFSEVLKTAREKDMLPQAAAEMPAGARMPAMFGGRLAAWVNMPQPGRKSASVTDERKLLAWAQENHPHHVETVTEVRVDAALVAFLREHRPQSLHDFERTEPQWAEDVCKALADTGRYALMTGDIVTEVPGITVSEGRLSVPSVSLTDDAGEVIGAAWARGEIDLGEVLALPAPQEAGDAS
jgi:hypothetical protein